MYDLDITADLSGISINDIYSRNFILSGVMSSCPEDCPYYYRACFCPDGSVASADSCIPPCYCVCDFDVDSSVQN